ncbi:type III-A CRISPR-associated protein Cas10/Csm1 [Wolinella succinogenes]|uniref:type III-A CRISPR-associated protein Cas10/Csm1 n=1 Tax=Wolinella succinogenes TaxID=844 RepID=UPI0024095A5F|nr:type III-A CRISPR-associated protein Cas10/Csm1 [Wolinella succinogenes]
MKLKSIDSIAVAALLHDIGKFGQRAEVYKLREGVYKKYDYKYAHASYTAQILEEMGFNLGDELSDASAMHHNPTSQNAWIIASADRMASAFEREKFKTYNEKSDKEDFKKQRLWYLFDDKKRFKIAPLSSENIFAEEDKAVNNEYDALWNLFVEDLKKVKEKSNSSIDFFTIDYLMKKYTSFIPSSTSFKAGEYDAVKANIPLYEHSKATAIFASAIYKLVENGNRNIINYYKYESSDIEKKDLLLICGDFFGIQKFIFDSVPAAKASKILRAKSAYIQILTKIIAFYIVEELGLSYQSIISTNAGKFEILGINTEETKTKLKVIQKEIDEFFIKNYFGETGIGVSFVEASLSDFIIEGQYKERLRKAVDEAVESSKFQKFDLSNISPVMEYDEGIDNQNLCPLCGKRKIVDEYCKVCIDFVKIGENLAKSNYLIISKGFGQPWIFGDYFISFAKKPKVYENQDIAIFDIANDEKFRGFAKWELASYVKKNGEAIETFEDLADASCGGGEEGIKAIMSLKGDVDGMGKYISNKDNEVTNSFARFNFFSRMMDYFFSVYASEKMKGKNIYTVFAGGDDIFILGAWDEVLEFAKELREDFMKFASGSGLTISMGMVLTKPNKPINFVAQIAEEGLEEAKNYKPTQEQKDKEKNAITLFGETIGWEEYILDMLPDFEIINDMAKKYPETFNTAFWYRLLEFCDMRANLDDKENLDIKNALWKSKLAYSFRRNIMEKHKDKNFDEVLKQINENIDTYGSAFKMVIFEELYKRRKS